MLTTFENSFLLSNYEYTHKTATGQIEVKEDEKRDIDYDKRRERFKKKIENYGISTQNKMLMHTEEAIF
jgi:hypothetical protein